MIALTSIAGSVCLCGVCSHEVVLSLIYQVVLLPCIVCAMVVLTVMRELLYVCDVSVLTESEAVMVTEMLVCGSGEMWLRCVSIWVVHVVQVLCLVQTLC